MSLKQKELYPENFKEAIQIAEQKKSRSLFVFDLDSTLFCMKYRTQAIIRDCLNDSHFCEQFAKHLPTIKKIIVTKRDWSVEEILSRYGFSKTEPLVLAIRKIWHQKFFINDYLNLDKPYKGCVQFIQHIAIQGAHITYLTARRHQTMREGTLQSLKYWNFPLEKEEQLIMKKTEVEDSIYKVTHLKKLIKNYEVILLFENEPVILNRVAREIPQISLFWIDSTHSRKEQPPKRALTLSMKYAW